MEFLKAVLGADLYGKMEAAITAYNGNPDNQQIKLCNLTAGEYVSKGKCVKLEADKDKAEKALEAATALIEQLKTETPPDEAEYQRRVSDLEQQIKQVKIDAAVKVAFINAGVADIDYMNFKLHEAGELELDDSGNVKGLADMINRLKTANPDSFTRKETSGSYDGLHIPVVNDTRPAMNRDNLLHLPYGDRMKLFMENPDEYREIINN